MNPARRGFRRFWPIAALFVAAGLGGCQQLSARRDIQNGNSLFEDEKYEEAAAAFEAALELEPHLDVADYNAGLCYYKLFRPGTAPTSSEFKKNKGYADSAVKHFQAWLQSNPDDNDTAELISEIWVNSGDYDKALAYWQGERDAHPKEARPIKQIASIYYKQNKFDETAKAYSDEATVEPAVADQVTAYLQVGRLAFQRLSDFQKVQGEMRIHYADIGISALQKAAALDPHSIEAESMQGALYNLRALAHGAYWAEAIDKAIALHHTKRVSVIREEAKKQQPASPAPQPGPGQAGG
jgi:tetratricopeptide (TPR) repeat protein